MEDNLFNDDQRTVLNFLLKAASMNHPIAACWMLHDYNRKTTESSEWAWKAYRRLDPKEEAEVLVEFGKRITEFWEEREDING